MDPEFKRYEKLILEKYRCDFSTTYEETIPSSIRLGSFPSVVILIFKKLDWDLVYNDGFVLEAKVGDELGQWTEKVEVSYQYGKVKIKSFTLDGVLGDTGRNSIRVKLFIYAFEQTISELDKEALKNLENKYKEKIEWNDYVVPEKLPPPWIRKKPNFTLFIIGALLTAVVVSFIMALVLIELQYLILIFEIGVAYLVSKAFLFIVHRTNFTDPDIINSLLYGVMTFIFFFFINYFQYIIQLSNNSIAPTNFIQFVDFKLQSGLLLGPFNTGWIGWVIAWILQVLIARHFAYANLEIDLYIYMRDKIPVEVNDFACYHLYKGKTKEEMCEELAKMGWTEKQHQEEVLDSIEAALAINEFRRN